MGHIAENDETAVSLELERTFLLKYLPENLGKCSFKEVLDIYVPKAARHPRIRIRKMGQTFEITKKEQISKADASRQTEQTLPLTKEEFRALSKLEGKRIYKRRYIYNYKGRTAEIDIFKKELEGLAIAEFEFNDYSDMNSFKMPEFCLADVTQEEFIAGGVLCGKSYPDIEKKLSKFGYSKIIYNGK
jgi:CYTH domain-containing protein